MNDEKLTTIEQCTTLYRHRVCFHIQTHHKLNDIIFLLLLCTCYTDVYATDNLKLTKSEIKATPMSTTVFAAKASNQVCALADNCSSRAHNSCGIT